MKSTEQNRRWRTTSLSRQSHCTLWLAALLVMMMNAEAGGAATIPFPDALDAAAVAQPGDMADPVDHALLLGNGDLNGLLYAPDEIILRLTKNDAWDNRIETAGDGPLLQMDLRQRTWTGGEKSPPSYRKPYPCPRLCGIVRLGKPSSVGRRWQAVRTARENAFELRGGLAVMVVGGVPDSSNGYACELEAIPQGWVRLRLVLSGTPNAEYFVHLKGAGGGRSILINSGWRPGPKKMETVTFELPPGGRPARLELYARTQRAMAEIRYKEIVFEGAAGQRHALGFDPPLVSPPVPSRLDLRRATAELKPSADSAPTVARALAGRNVFLIRSPRPAELIPIVASELPKPETGTRDGVRWIRQALPGDVDYKGMAFVMALAEAGERKAIAVLTTNDAPDPLAAAIDLARHTLNSQEAALIREHEAAWEAFWSASGVELADSLLSDAWYRNLYFLRCVSRPGVQAAAIYAGLVAEYGAWKGAYTYDYNTEQTFWSAFACNHLELAEPYVRLVREYLPRAQWLAKTTYDCNGAFFPVNTFGTEPIPPAQCKSNNRRMTAYVPWTYVPALSAWWAQNLWLHYAYQPDRAFLEKTVYPVLKEVATFYADFMDRCARDERGKAVLGPSYSPEHGKFGEQFNTPSDIAFFRLGFQMAAEAARVLGRDARDAARWRACLERLPEYPVRDGVVVDWLDGPTTLTHNVAVPSLPVFPAGVVNWLSPEPEQALFRHTIATMKWTGYNSAIMLAAARARLGMSDAFAWMRQAIAERARPNGTQCLLPRDRNGIFTETFAWSGVIAECLLQSEGGVLRLFPAWPGDKDAQFTQLRAQGGFLVSAARARGQMTRLEIKSTAGGRLSLLSPWPTMAANGTILKTDARGIVTLKTRSGELMRFTKE